LTQSGHPACDAKKFLDPNVSYLSQDFRWVSLTSGSDGYTAGTASFVSTVAVVHLPRTNQFLHHGLT
jgi:hypothetical protein